MFLTKDAGGYAVCVCIGYFVLRIRRSIWLLVASSTGVKQVKQAGVCANERKRQNSKTAKPHPTASLLSLSHSNTRIQIHPLSHSQTLCIFTHQFLSCSHTHTLHVSVCALFSREKRERKHKRIHFLLRHHPILPLTPLLSILSPLTTLLNEADAEALLKDSQFPSSSTKTHVRLHHRPLSRTWRLDRLTIKWPLHQHLLA